MNAATDAVQQLKRHTIGEHLFRRNPLYYGGARRVLEEMDAAGLEARREWSHERLSQVLRAAQRAPYGRQVRGGDTLESWPLLAKETLRDNLGSFVTGRDWLSAPASTGGTTGIPLKLVRSLPGIVFEQACQDRLIERLGADPRRSRLAILRGDNVKDPNDRRAPNYILANGGRCMIMSSNVLSQETIEDYAHALNDFKPELLCAYPTSLEWLCRLLYTAGLPVHVPCVLTSSEVLKREAWTLAREVLGCNVSDYYGQAERVGFAYAFAPRDYRFVPAYSYVELLPFRSDSIEDAGQGGLYEVVGTSFWNDLMPLVRYRTGDLVRLPESWGERELEEVRLGLRTFSGVLGREQEILVCPKGVRLTGIDHIPRDVNHVLRIQVIQESLDDVRILVLPAPGYSERDARHLLDNARAKVPNTMRLRIETAEYLERTPRGKTPLVIHRPPVQQKLREQGVEPHLTR